MSNPENKKYGGLSAFDRFLTNLKSLFVKKTDSASSSNSGISKLYTDIGNNTDGSITQKKITEELSSKLPYSGGTLTGNIYTTPYYNSTIVNPDGGQITIISKGKNNKGTHPTSISETHTLVAATDQTGDISSLHKYGHVQTSINTSGVTTTEISAFKDIANANNSASISVSIDDSGNITTYAPTPGSTSNDTNIATTAFVKSIVPTYTAGAGLSLTSNEFSLDTSGATTGSYGPSENITGNEGTTVNIPYITVDEYGRVTSISDKVYTSKNSTYNDMTGATSSAVGTHGLVPAPAAGDQNKFLKGNGSWETPYLAMTASEASEGISTVDRVISAKILHDKIEEYDDDHVISDTQIVNLWDIEDSVDKYY